MDKRICCCDPGTGTQMIGYLQIFWSAGGVIMVVIAGILVAIKNPNEFLDDTGDVIALAVYFLVMFCWSILSLAMGIILLRGSFHRNLRLIDIWSSYASINLVVGTLLAIVQWAFLQEHAILLSLIITPALQGLCFWIVGVHRQEIMEESLRTRAHLLESCPEA